MTKSASHALTVKGFAIWLVRMKNISVRISADDESIGAFTLSRSETIRLLASAGVNSHYTLAEYVHELVRFAMYDCGEYDSPLIAPEANDILAVAVSGQKSKRSRQ